MYGWVRVNDGPVRQTFSRELRMKPSTSHCLDFHYYLTSNETNANIEVGGDTSDTKLVLGTVTSNSIPMWQQFRIEFTTPSDEYLTVRFGV